MPGSVMDGWLQRVRKTEEYSDVVVRVNGEDFHLHMLPLQNASAYFRNLPSSGSDETVQPEQARCKLVTIHDLPGGVEGFATCVDMCYLLDPELTERNVARVCAAAEFLAMEEVVETTKQFMHTNIFSHWRSCVNFLHNYTRVGSLIDDYMELECKAIIESACVKSFTETKHLSAPSSYRVSGPQKESGCGALTELVVQVCALPDVYVGAIVDSLVATDVNLNLKCRQGRNVRQWLENVECRNEKARGWMVLWLSRMLVKNVPVKRPWMELSSQYWCCLLEQVGLLLPLLDHPLKARLTEVKATLEEKIGQSLDEMDEYLRDYKFSATTLLSLVENFTTTRLQESSPQSLQEIANDVDQFLWFYAEENSISTDTFLRLVRAFPPCARSSHDTVYGAMEKLLLSNCSPLENQLQRSLIDHSNSAHRESKSSQLRTVLHRHSQELADDETDDIDHSHCVGSQLRTVPHRHSQELADDVTNGSQLRIVLRRHSQELGGGVTDGIDHSQYSPGSQSLRTVLHRHSQELADDVTDGRHLKHIMQKIIDASLNLLEENSQRSREIVALQKQYGELIDCRTKRLGIVEDFLRRKHSISSETEGSEISDTTTVSSSITVLGYNPGMRGLRDNSQLHHPADGA